MRGNLPLPGEDGLFAIGHRLLHREMRKTVPEAMSERRLSAFFWSCFLAALYGNTHVVRAGRKSYLHTIFMYSHYIRYVESRSTVLHKTGIDLYDGFSRLPVVNWGMR
jgi:hypothetical protein